jgi:5-aminolevulinate synthase
MIEGMKNSKAPKKIFKHNDMKHLEQLLREVDINTPKVIAFESVYSMSGSIGNIKDIVALAKKYNALTFCDEVHAVGLYGKGGSGISSEQGIADQIDMITGTMGKAIGVYGGYLVGNQHLIDCIRSFGPGFIFTTSLPPSVTSGCIASIEYLIKHGDKERKLHKIKTELMRKKLIESGLPVLKSESHIIPLLIGDPYKVKEVSRMLLDDFGIYVQPINYPTVPLGQEMLRLCPGPTHSKAVINEFITAA